MSKELAIKTYNVDYTGIVKRILGIKKSNEEDLWGHSFTIFQYKDMSVDVSLYRIDVYDETVSFKVKVTIDGRSTWNIAYISLSVKEINFLKQKIYSAAIDSIESLEGNRITEETPDIFSELEFLEKDAIEEAVKQFSEEKGIENSAIIESMEDTCKDEFCMYGDLRRDYFSNKKHSLFYEYYEEFCKAIKKTNYNFDTSDYSYKYLDKAQNRYDLLDSNSNKLKEQVMNYLNDKDYVVDFEEEED